MNDSCKIVNNVQIEGIVSCLPNNLVLNQDFKDIYKDKEIEQVCKSIGVNKRYYVSKNTKTSDLCLKAANHLIECLNWDKASIDGVILLTQTPDRLLPSSATRIQHLLGLSANSFAFDVNLGCSAYPYGLWIASSLLQTGAKKIILLAGDTISKIVDRKDRSSAFLFGDAGSATALSLKNSNPIKFILGTDGEGSENICANYSDFLKMNGSKVFEFSLSRVPNLVKEIDLLNGGPHNFYFFHQANKFMLNYLKKKCKISENSFPINIHKFGNTSSASIPLLMTDELFLNKTNKSSNVSLIGFGVGFSWAAASLNLSSSIFLENVFYKEN